MKMANLVRNPMKASP